MNVTPIRRNQMFYDEDEYKYEIALVEEYLENDLNNTVVVYEVDREKTNIDSVYKEAKQGNIRYKTPKEIPCQFEIEDSQLNAFDGKTSTGAYQISGNLKVYTLNSTLEKYKCDIRRGDYLAIQIDTNRMQYFTVVDDGKVNTSNKNIIGAYKVSWREIIATPCAEFNGR